MLKFVLSNATILAIFSMNAYTVSRRRMPHLPWLQHCSSLTIKFSTKRIYKLSQDYFILTFDSRGYVSRYLEKVASSYESATNSGTIVSENSRPILTIYRISLLFSTTRFGITTMETNATSVRVRLQVKI